MRIFGTIIPIDLVTNSLLPSFCLFLQTKNNNQVFIKMVVWQREIFLLFVYSESRFTSKPCQIRQTNSIKEISYLLFMFVLQFHASTIFMIPSIACCKLPCLSFWIVKRQNMSRSDNASLTWTGSILLFVNVQKNFFSFTSQHKNVLKEKELIVELDIDQKLLLNIYLYI